MSPFLWVDIVVSPDDTGMLVVLLQFDPNDCIMCASFGSMSGGAAFGASVAYVTVRRDTNPGTQTC